MAQAGFRLLSAKSLKNEASASTLPSRFKILDWGVNNTLKGEFIVNETTLAVLPTNQAKMGRDTVALDYEHNTVAGSVEYERTREPRETAAHFKVEVVKGDGVYLSHGEYTASGVENAKNYPDLSPTLFSNEKGEVIGIHSVALTRTGAKVDLHFDTLSVLMDDPYAADLVALSAGSGCNAYRIVGMDTKFGNSMNLKPEHRKAFRTLMGMGDGATDEEMLSAMGEEACSGKLCRNGPLDGAGNITPTAGVEKEVKAFLSSPDFAATFKTLIAPLEMKVTTLTAAADTATQSTERAARESLVQRASRQGKIIPLSDEQIFGDSGKNIQPITLSVLSSIVDGIPKTVSGHRNPAATVSKNANGKIITLSNEGGETKGLDRTRNAFQEQIEAANGRNVGVIN